MRPEQRPRVTDCYEMFLLDGEASGFTPHTLRFYRGRLSPFLAWCEQQQLSEIGELAPTHLRRYFVDTQRRGVSSAYLQHG